MHEFPASLDRFIRRVYRRLVVLRLLEWAGLGFAAACATSLLSLLILRNRTDSLLPIAATQIALGIAVGFIAALLRRPHMLDAAVEADRQLDLADLLATAWQLRRGGVSPPSLHASHEPDFEQAVLLIANDRAAHLHPRSVVLHRLGLRAWSGIGLAGALVLTVAILTANPLHTEASSSSFFPQPASNKSPRDQNASRNNAQFSSRPAPISPDHPNGEDAPLPGAGKTTDTATTSAARAQNSDVQASNPNGAGTGSGKSPSSPDKSNPPLIGVDASRTNKTGESASGVGVSNENSNATTGNNTSTSAGNSNKSPTAPAWQSDSWPAAQQAANTAITNGQIPPAYHDLVREYFKR